jgi:aryl-phospho-beta-D-glucosidase BglC (GH1 family)
LDGIGNFHHGSDGVPIHLRGFNVNWWVPPTQADAVNIRNLGANCVRYMFGYNPKGTYEPKQIDEVERQIHYFTSQGLWVIPVLYEFEVADPAHPHDSKKKLGPWSTPTMNQEFLALWTDIITRLKNEPKLAAWEPINEPHDTDPAIVSAWYRDLLPRLRQLDPVRPIVVEGANYSHAEDLTDSFKMDDANVIYAFHFYNPYNYTTDIQKPPLVYPGPWGKQYLAKTMEPALRFRDRQHVPIWCGEWGTKTAAPGYDLWLRDVFDLLQSDKLDWCIWSWALQPKDPQNTSFDINTQKSDVYHVVANFFGP